jgi:hypothetical protein
LCFQNFWNVKVFRNEWEVIHVRFLV